MKVWPTMSVRFRWAASAVEVGALRGRRGERLLDEGVLAGKQGCLAELVVRRDGRGDQHGVDLGIAGTSSTEVVVRTVG